MKIFISWSGARSRKVAEALRTFLAGVIPVAKPWVSTQSIAAGSVWYPELSRELGQSGFGLLCLTKGNLKAPWIAFEAGALADFYGAQRVCPYLLDVEISQLHQLGLPYPLFQAVPSSKRGTERLVASIVDSLVESERPDPVRTAEYFRASWRRLRKAITEANSLDEPQSESDRLIAELTHQNKQSLEELARCREELTRKQEALMLRDKKISALAALLKASLEAQFGQAHQLLEKLSFGELESR
jgi:hypothetical protein